MKRVNLKTAILNEDFKFSQPEEDQVKFNNIDKSAFIKKCKQFSKYSPFVYSYKNLMDYISEIKDLIDIAEQLTLQETENWFDSITVQRHIKQLKEAYKIFEKTGTEMNNLQQRLVASYEDIGEVLSKYYDIS